MCLPLRVAAGARVRLRPDAGSWEAARKAGSQIGLSTPELPEAGVESSRSMGLACASGLIAIQTHVR